MRQTKKGCPETELNRRHEDFQSSALPTELSGQALHNRYSAATNNSIQHSRGFVKTFFKKIYKKENFLLTVDISSCIEKKT